MSNNIEKVPDHRSWLRRIMFSVITAISLLAGVLAFAAPSAADPTDRHPGTGPGPTRTDEQDREMYDLVVRAEERVTHHQEEINKGARQMITEINQNVPSLDRYAAIRDRMQSHATQLARAEKQLRDRVNEYHNGQGSAAGRFGELVRFMRHRDPERWDRLDAMVREMVRTGRKSDNIIDLRSGPSFRELTAHGQFLLEQQLASEGRNRIAMIPDICYTSDGVFRSTYCSAFEPFEIDGRRLLNSPRYCRERAGIYQCANHKAAVPPNKAQPAFGNFLCARNHVVYWSNGTNAYSQVDELHSIRRCPDVDRSWIFTGKYVPDSGGGASPRPPEARDCPNDVDEQGNVECRDDRPINGPRPPAGNYGCIQHERNNLWKCPGDTTYHRPEPVDTSRSGDDDSSSVGRQHVCSTNRHYWVKGDRYWQQTEKDRIKTCPELESQGLSFQQWRWDANGDKSER